MNVCQSVKFAEIHSNRTNTTKDAFNVIVVKNAEKKGFPYTSEVMLKTIGKKILRNIKRTENSEKPTSHCCVQSFWNIMVANVFVVENHIWNSFL